jgi:hypothetical protein
MGCPAPQTRQPEPDLAAQPASRRRGRPGCPDTGHAVRRCVRVRCPPCRRTSSTGRADTRCPGVRCPGVRCPRDWRPHDRGDPGVRTHARPVSAAAAAARSAPRWIPDVGAAGPATVGAPGWTCRCGRRAAWSSLPASGLAGTGWSNSGSAWLAQASTAALAAAWQAHRLRRRAGRLADPGSWSSARCRSVGGGAGRAGAPTSPRVCGLGGSLACWPTWAGPGGGDHAGWSVRWWWSGVVRCWRAPSGSAGSSRRPQRGRGRSGALSARSL